MALFMKECRKIVTSIPYVIFVVVLLAFSYTQIIPEFTKIEKPQVNQESYGMKSEELPELIMPEALKSLFNEFSANNYIAYPIGFYKNVKLNNKKQTEIAQILSDLTGVSKDELLKTAGEKSVGQSINIGDGSGLKQDENGNYVFNVPDTTENTDNSTKISSVTLSESITYEHFLELMKQTDELIGGGSQYSNTHLIRNFGKVPVTYEEALADYNNIVEQDELTGAYARLFCDYLGMMVALLPVFVAVGIVLKDRKARMCELVFTRKASSAIIVITRYLAMLFTMMLPVLLMAAYATVSVNGMYSGVSLDYLAFFKYSLGWLLPTLMTSAAVGLLFTELTDSPIAIAIQGLWWFFGMFDGIKQLKGGYDGLVLSPRHNTLGNTQVYLESFRTLLVNRIFYTLLSALLVALTIIIYELKRRGKLDVYGNFKKIF